MSVPRDKHGSHSLLKKFLLAADRDHYREPQLVKCRELLLGTQAQGASPKSGQNECKSRQSRKVCSENLFLRNDRGAIPTYLNNMAVITTGGILTGPTTGQTLHHIHISNIKQTQQFVFIHICNNNKENDTINLQGSDEWGIWKDLEKKEGENMIVF